MLNLNHKKLDVWKMSLELTKDIYRITENFPKSESFGLTSQLRRATVSIASNLAEGSARKSRIERIRFYEISRSSLVEVDTHLEIAYLLKCTTLDEINPVGDKMNHIFAMISKLILNTR